MQTLFIILGFWIIVEAFIAADKMQSGDRLCRLLKYTFTLFSGLISIYLGINKKGDLTHLFMLISISLFIWPVILYRLSGRFKNRVSD
jgi:hypothetical protein